jgi:hypothetical protein
VCPQSPDENKQLFHRLPLEVVEKAGEISFLGRGWEITSGESKQVTIVQQPESFRIIAHPPTPQSPQWPDILAEYRL